MSIITAVRNIVKNLRSMSLENPSTTLFEALGGFPSKTGVTVNEKTALNYSAVYACIRLLTETISTLPVHIYEKTADGGRKEAASHKIAMLLKRPNPAMTGLVFREVMQGHIETHGNAFAVPKRNGAGEPVELWPVVPTKLRVLVKNDQKYFQETATGKVFFNTEVFHIPGFGYNGYEGYSPIQLAKESIGLGLAAEEFGARLFANSAKPGGVFEHPGKLSDDAFKRLKAQIDSEHLGLSNSHKTKILEEGMTWKTISIPPEDAQFLQTRQFQVTEICRWYGVKPHMVADLERATFSNIEHQSIEGTRDTFRPRAIRWEEAINCFFFKQEDPFYCKFNLDALLRGDVKSRYEAYGLLLDRGVYNADEVRSLEDMNPQEGGIGKSYLVQLNMMDKKSLLSIKPGDSRAIRSEKRDIADIISARRELSKRYKEKLTTAAEKLVRLEVKNIREAAKTLLNRSAGDFEAWINKDYQEFEKEIKAALAGILEKFSDDMAPLIKAEVGDLAIDAEIKRFAADYIDGYAKRHMRSTTGQLMKLLKSENFQEEIERRLVEWEEKRAEKIGSRESSRGRNAFAKAGYVAAGFTKIVSVAFGKSCPYCNALDGQVIGTDSYFLKSGDSFEPDGADEPLTVSSNLSHPPYHDGCDCDIKAGV